MMWLCDDEDAINDYDYDDDDNDMNDDDNDNVDCYSFRYSWFLVTMSRHLKMETWFNFMFVWIDS